jgi:hypothetical protein
MIDVADVSAGRLDLNLERNEYRNHNQPRLIVLVSVENIYLHVADAPAPLPTIQVEQILVFVQFELKSLLEIGRADRCERLLQLHGTIIARNARNGVLITGARLSKKKIAMTRLELPAAEPGWVTRKNRRGNQR